MRDTHLREEKVRLDTKLDGDRLYDGWNWWLDRITRIINRSIESNLVSLAKNGILIHRANRSIWQNSAIEETNLESKSIREFKKIILSRIHCDFEYRFFFFFLIQLRFCEKDRWRRKRYLSILYPRNASIGSVLERGVYSIYSHDYSRALYFADRATLSIDFFRYGNWDSGVDLTVLGSPCPFFHDLVVHGRGR